MRMPGTSYAGELPAADAELTRLAEALRRHVSKLAGEIGERNVSDCPRQLAQAADYLEAEWSAAKYKVERQTFEVAGGECCNLHAELRGATRPKEIVVIGAHYDSVVGTPGANDNGTGVAALLALAAKFAGRRSDRTLRWVAFVNEEPPYFQSQEMGSWVYAKRCREQGEKITGMLSLETIGYYSDTPGSQNYPPPFGLLYPTTGNFIAFVGNVRSAGLVRQVVETFRKHEPFPSEAAALPEPVPGVGFSDQWSFWQHGYPGLMVTDTAMFRYPHYHERTDTVDKVDFDKTARVVRGLEKVIADLITVRHAPAGAERTERAGGQPPADGGGPRSLP